MKWMLVFWGLLMLGVALLFGLRMKHRQDERQAAQIKAHAAQAAAGTQALREPFPVGEFRLIERSGEIFESSSLMGQVWIASFFFAACPGQCLRMNNTLADLHKELSAQGADVRLVSITVDPDNDTPAALAKYANHYRADPQGWLFLTTSTDPPADGAPRPTELPPDERGIERIQKIGNDCFRLPVQRQDHSSRLVLVDRQGLARGYYSGTDDNQMKLLRRKLDEVLAEVASEAPATSAGDSTVPVAADAVDASTPQP